MTAPMDEVLIEALARRAGLDIALRDHRTEVIAAAHRAHAQSAAMAWDIPVTTEPAPSLRIEGSR
jgi:hypothetical protein